MSDLTLCRNGADCPAGDTIHGAPTHGPYCTACLDRAGRDIRNLIYDYIDLAQLHETSLSQAPSDTSRGSQEPPLPIATHVEALQAEIVHVTTTWEYEIRVARRLPDPTNPAPIADWHTTIRYPQPAAKVRPGHAVQRAVSILTTHLHTLAALPATAVCPTGVEDDPQDLDGGDAIEHLQHLHARARSMLGRTRRTFWIPGECWNPQCGARPTPGVDGPLWRSEPRHAEDPMQVGCHQCGAQRPYPDYEQYMTSLLWPQPDQVAA